MFVEPTYLKGCDEGLSDKKDHSSTTELLKQQIALICSVLGLQHIWGGYIDFVISSVSALHNVM